MPPQRASAGRGRGPAGAARPARNLAGELEAVGDGAPEAPAGGDGPVVAAVAEAGAGAGEAGPAAGPADDPANDDGGGAAAAGGSNIVQEVDSSDSEDDEYLEEDATGSSSLSESEEPEEAPRRRSKARKGLERGRAAPPDRRGAASPLSRIASPEPGALTDACQAEFKAVLRMAGLRNDMLEDTFAAFNAAGLADVITLIGTGLTSRDRAVHIVRHVEAANNGVLPDPDPALFTAFVGTLLNVATNREARGKCLELREACLMNEFNLPGSAAGPPAAAADADAGGSASLLAGSKREREKRQASKLAAVYMIERKGLAVQVARVPRSQDICAAFENLTTYPAQLGDYGEYNFQTEGDRKLLEATTSKAKTFQHVRRKSVYAESMLFHSWCTVLAYGGIAIQMYTFALTW